MKDFRKYAFIVGIAVLFTVLVFFTMDAIYPKPDYSNYCNEKSMPVKINNYNNCSNVNINDTLLKDCSAKGGHIDYKYDSSGCVAEPFCQACDKNYQDAREKYNRLAFFITVIIGAIAILFGLYSSYDHDYILTGFIYGGILTVIISTMTYVSSLSKWSKVIVIFLELVLLILIGLKKIK